MGRRLVERRAICLRCGDDKDVALVRCRRCGHQPSGEERELAVLCSALVLDPSQLTEVQHRLRRGEALKPSVTLLNRARAVLYGEPARSLSRKELGLLALANGVVTPLLGWAVWWRYRHVPAGRQAALITAPIHALWVLLWVLFRISLSR